MVMLERNMVMFTDLYTCKGFYYTKVYTDTYACVFKWCIYYTGIQSVIDGQHKQIFSVCPCSPISLNINVLIYTRNLACILIRHFEVQI